MEKHCFKGAYGLHAVAPNEVIFMVLTFYRSLFNVFLPL